MSAVRLLRRDGSDWVEQRVEKIDAADIEDRLQDMIAAVDDDASVALFLPRDQILFTQVDLEDGDPRAQIEAAMNGRTPYSLEELALDWEISDGNKAHVAAIARDTLDEAAAFAEVRGLPIAGYGTLHHGADFPRMPTFDGPNIVQPEPDAESVEQPAPPQFATARVPSRPPDVDVAAASMAATAKARFTPTASDADKPLKKAEPAPPVGEEPVVQVEDKDPVVKVKAPLVPLDPGIPISAPNAPPRVRTDIAAASVSGHAASLSPGGLVKPPKRGAPISTAAIFAAAFFLMIGVAALVWSYLPMRPSTAIEPPASSSENLANEQDEDSSALSPNQAAEEAVPVELPKPATDPQTDIAEFAAPTPDEGATVPASSAVTRTLEIARLPVEQGNPLPLALETTPPNPTTPQELANIQVSAPSLVSPPSAQESTDSIYFGAFELPQVSMDAIALPSVARIDADTFIAPDGPTVAALPAQPSTAADTEVADAVEQALADALAGPGGLIQTELAASLPQTPPRPRLSSLGENIERQRFGGRTRAELSEFRPPARPASTQATTPAAPASELAVANSLLPRPRPGDFQALVAAAEARREAERLASATALRAPDTSGAIEAALQDDAEPAARPTQPQRLSIPTNASVARQATIPDAIRLNRVNLVGVYGAPSDRRALVRLPSGRYVKVKVGDRVDGGTVARITDDALFYRKGNRTLSLQIPQG